MDDGKNEIKYLKKDNSFHMVKLIDSHCHLDSEVFFYPQKIIQECVARGIFSILIPGYCQEQISKVSEMIKEYNLIGAIGIHPLYTNNLSKNWQEKLIEYIQTNNRFVAIGEIGLDKKDINYNEEVQTAAFLDQVDIAKNYNLPLILHVRKAHQVVLKHLQDRGFKNRGIVHAFSGSIEEAKIYLKLGFKLGIGGPLTYPKSVVLKKIITELPVDSFVLETDAPFLPPDGVLKGENSPLNLEIIFNKFHEYVLKKQKIEKEELSLQIINNFFEVIQNARQFY